MNVELLNRWLSWAAIALPLLTVVASARALYTRSILNARAAAELDALKPWRLSADQRTKLTEELRLLPAGRVVFSHRLWTEMEEISQKSLLRHSKRLGGRSAA